MAVGFWRCYVVRPNQSYRYWCGKNGCRDAYKDIEKALQGKMAKHVNAQVIKKAQLQANKAAFASAVKRGALYEGFIQV